MTRIGRWIVGLAITLMFVAPLSCAPTSFVGDAQFPGGALGCFKQCEKAGMEMGSFVYVGEYSTACACKPKVAGTHQQGALEPDGDIEGSVVAAAAGVELQRRRAAEQQQTQQSLPRF